MLQCAVSRAMFVFVFCVFGCHRPRVSTRAESGCGAGAYPGQPAQRRAALWPDPLLGVARHAALHVTATDAATGEPATPLNIWIIRGTDTLKARTNPQGAAEFTGLSAGPAEVLTWFFNFAQTRDSVLMRTGFRDSVVLRLGRTGNECLIVPDSGRRAQQRGVRP